MWRILAVSEFALGMVMGDMFWTSYGVIAGVALGSAATVIGLLVAQARIDARTLQYAKHRRGFERRTKR